MNMGQPTATRLREVPREERWHAFTAAMIAMCAACIIVTHIIKGHPLIAALVPFAAACAYADLRWGILPDALTLPALVTSLALIAATQDLMLLGLATAASAIGTATFWLLHVLPSDHELVGGGDPLYMGFVLAASALTVSHPAIDANGYTIATSCVLTIFLGSIFTFTGRLAMTVIARRPRKRSAPIAPGFGLAAMILPTCPALVTSMG